MKAVRFLTTVEHRFVHEKDEVVSALNDVAALGARMIAQADVPDLDMLASVWKVLEGAEMSVPEKCAAKLILLGYAELAADPVAAPVVEPAPVAEAVPVAAPTA
ncbi:hypothetical protein MMSR116_29075 [Methylobacterium mesophilicum SR1.6/6]|uniref:Uncharacterized protein n=1 Tax=Methylobacterium mesophilicum SR1.6/6 TaxID=908290 RepID=A0A6B9FTY0_9HYPH|nr:hypothetical protein [Methylobacterium mesophilicum]QGY05492.1 hypothetical protein MMSR116_29075 [Methylobacterium mesophilicum SR1.6/6]